MKTEAIVSHLVGNAMHELQGCSRELDNLLERARCGEAAPHYDKLSQLESFELDYKVAREKLNAALKLLDLLV